MAVPKEQIDQRKLDFFENTRNMLVGSEIEKMTIQYNFQETVIMNRSLSGNNCEVRPRMTSTDLFELIIKKGDKKYRIQLDVIQSQFEEIKEQELLK